MRNEFDIDDLHHCGDYLNNHMLRGRCIGDEVICHCDRIWTLLPQRWWLYLKFWRVQGSLLPDAVWWHDKLAERRRKAVAR